MRANVGACIGLVLGLAWPAYSEPPSPSAADQGRGFVFGLGLGPGRIGFSGAEDLAVVVGGVTGTESLPFGGGVIVLRAGQVVPRALVPANAERVVPIPRTHDGLGLSLSLGWAFSERLALLADADIVAGGWEEGFNNAMLGLVARYSPASRLWIEAGPALGALRYGYASSVAENVSGTGSGMLVAAGVAVVRKPRWLLDVQARVGTLWYDKFRATNVSFQLGVSRRRRG